MNKLISLILILALAMSVIGCAGRTGSSGSRDNATDLKESPCAGCFGESEKKRLGIEGLNNA